MLLRVEATTTVEASAEEVLEFVMDAERYMEADTKIRKIISVERTGNEAFVKMRVKFRGVPVSARQQIVLTPGEGIDVRNVPSWQDRFVDFTGTFRCEPDGTGTRVTHAYEFKLTGPFGYLAKPLKPWLDKQIHEEVALIKQILERPAAPTSGAR